MPPKLEQHKKAIYLRRKGYSYSEIAKLLKVSQGSLSLWLRSVSIENKYQNLLKSKQKKGQLRGALSRRENRLKQENIIFAEAEREINNISTKDLWLMGIIAYWCEGAKQKTNNVSQGVCFVNSDPFLLKLFIKWLKEICKIADENIKYTLYIHENAAKSKAINYWSRNLNISVSKFGKTVFKRQKIKTNRSNIRSNYFGLVRITVSRSTDLNRKIKGWVLGVNNNI